MKLYALEPKFIPYECRVQAVFPEDINSFAGISVREDNDYTEDIKRLQFRIALDVFERKSSNLKYVGTDFYNGPEFIRMYGLYNFYTVSPKMKGLLEQLNLPKHRFYPINLIIDKGKPDLPYYILQIDATVDDYMDYSQSSFYVEDYDTNKITYYEKGELKDTKQKIELLDRDIFPSKNSLYQSRVRLGVYGTLLYDFRKGETAI